MATQKRLLKELKALLSGDDVPETILVLRPVKEDDLYQWTSVIHVAESSNSYYSGGYFRLLIHVPPTYPLEPPKIRFVTTSNEEEEIVMKSGIDNQYPTSTKIAHCNVDLNTGEICLDILKTETWSPAWTLQSCVLAVIVLLDNQEPDSPLNIDMANLIRGNDKVAIRSIINYYIKSSR